MRQLRSDLQRLARDKRTQCPQTSRLEQGGGWSIAGKWLRGHCLWGLCLVVSSAPLWADVSRRVDASGGRSELVRRLNSPVFQERLRAEEECRRSGAQLLPMLREALDSDDAELRRRAQHLIEQIENDELSGAIEEFLDPQLDSNLPGWSILADSVEDTPEIRAAYAEALRGNPQLSRAISHPESIGAELQRQLQRIGSQGSLPAGISPTRAIGILMLLVHPDANYSSDWGEVALRMIRNGIIQGTNETPSGQILQALVARVVVTPRAGLPQDRMELALRLSLPEVVTPAMELITQKNNPHQLNFAFVAIARYGGPHEMSIVEGMLNDTFELSTGHGPDNKKTSSTQLRDLALATLIVMNNQDPKSYGLREFPRDHSKNVTSLIIAFENDQQREAAIDKWRTWSAMHLRKFRALPANAEEGIQL